jgi:hypothetical protein
VTGDPTDPAAAVSTAPPTRTAEELRREIDRTREDLGQTVAALVYKVDVRSRAADRVRRWRAYAASDPLYSVGMIVVAAATAVAVGYALVLGRRRT